MKAADVSSPRDVGRVFVLGAGFSALAGLPTADGLLRLVRDAVADAVGSDNALERSLEDYAEYQSACGHKDATEPDFEQFAAYLDYQHFFRLKGSDTLTEEADSDQALLRWGIGRVLWKATPTELPPLYADFASRLRPLDYVITFNYDLVLEQALTSVGRRFRRFTDRYAGLAPFHSEVDRDAESDEVLILKPHGSIDWVSDRSYLSGRHRLLWAEQEYGTPIPDRDGVFGPEAQVRVRPLTEGPRPFDDPLKHIFVVENLDRFYDPSRIQLIHPPLVLAPSLAKQLYGSPFSAMFEASGRAEYILSGFGIIGYSLPTADPYAKQILYRMARSYTTALVDESYRLTAKRPIVVVDLRSTDEQAADLRSTYQFLHGEHTEWYLDGFSQAAVDRLFQAPSYLPPERR